MDRPANVFVTTLRDPLYYVPLTHPVDHTLLSRKYVATDVIEIASSRLLHWRAEFADKVVRGWKDGREAWISKRLLVARPAANWTWVEGDDPRIHWNSLPEFFQQFATDRSEGGADGFVRLADTPANRIVLQKAIQDDPDYKSSQFHRI
jgi:hypothetical protein